MQVKLLLVNFYLNVGLHAVSMGKPSERMSNCWIVRLLKLNPNRISVFRTSLVSGAAARATVLRFRRKGRIPLF